MRTHVQRKADGTRGSLTFAMACATMRKDNIRVTNDVLYRLSYCGIPGRSDYLCNMVRIINCFLTPVDAGRCRFVSTIAAPPAAGCWSSEQAAHSISFECVAWSGEDPSENRT